MNPIKTWAGKSTFTYTGSIETGTTITYGKAKTKARITKAQYEKLLLQFSGKTVEIGTSRSNAREGSLGNWFMSNIKNQALMSYIGVILIKENYAVKASDSTLRFIAPPDKTPSKTPDKTPPSDEPSSSEPSSSEPPSSTPSSSEPSSSTPSSSTPPSKLKAWATKIGVPPALTKFLP